ncbi:MAG TPA: D-alanine--D-alanine ligase family protein [Leptospiraceae bacterium]|jgi:D-alanine-D-alanine ligase|nr:D-alanine--D-alanine ligase [Leptospirales bacterium]HMW60212.1 D-alanine--D-alanine ligase family protein [Leptospiraceae bacterium]HMX58105.1 D-alanine--D-alanine ligase family protein [Leptospiraceae bacterium]HNE22500.1 D-alanine--D-alanine ligase family protein [Leptospiraceae bacterium]HNJ04313.1 D-alanine--D-alanine ligase family protein [Leptospiraceae bacterium]
MQSSKIRLGVLCGGRSSEHEISLRSAANVLRAVDRTRYDVIVVGIDRAGGWQIVSENALASKELLPVGKGAAYRAESLAGALPILMTCDVIFPVLHGKMGEDGTMQGFLRVLDLPFIGADVAGSAVGMDKWLMKRLLVEAGLPIGRYTAFRDVQSATANFATLRERFGMPLYVKPAAQGSSVGVHRVENETDFRSAVEDALRYDDVVLVEEAIAGREVECAVLGNEEPIASLCGEIIPKGGFYSYENKYLNEDGAAFEMPANLPGHVMDRLRKLAIETYRALDCAGLARVDFFLRPDESIIINEINTLPGFTSISMYPKLFELSGLPTPQLIDRLVHLARDRHVKQTAKKIDRV